VLNLLRNRFILFGSMAGLLAAQPPASLAIVSDLHGQDAIIIVDKSTRTPVYVANSNQAMILTPMVSPSGNVISFVVEGGQELRDLHHLAVQFGTAGIWEGRDSLISRVNNGSWPVCDDRGNWLLVMRLADAYTSGMRDDVCEISQGNILRISDNPGQNRYLWPLLSPDGNRLHYRILSQTPGVDGDKRSIRSIIYDRTTGTRTSHLVDLNLLLLLELRLR